MAEPAPEPASHRWIAFNFFLGILLPAVSILIEATTHINAEHFFDPIPTTWHVLLVAFVPCAHLQAWQAVRRGRAERGTLVGAANAFAVGVSLLYSIIYLPLLPIGLLALVFFGAGLLPLTPFFALACGLILRQQLRRIAPPTKALRLPGLAAGVGLAVLAVVLMEVPATLTRYGMQLAASDSPGRRDEGVRWLRAFGSRDYLLRASYGQTGRATDLASFVLSIRDPVTAEEARQIYYRVTGEVFNTRVPPRRIGARFEPQDNFDFDPDQGGEVIAGKVKNLSLASSRLDGSLDADAGVAYLEWTLLFRNDSASQQEARARVQLPPGGVVSRLTLWVNGEEREAAFAGRGQTRQAYQQVVRRRRDPVLVTTAGRDRVLVQCFPVPPGGGEMRIRFGITAPLALEDRTRALVALPRLLDRNFGIPAGLSHAVWVESTRPLAAEGERMRLENPRPGLYAVRGELKDAELSEATAVVRAERAGEVSEAWARDERKGEGAAVLQSVSELEPLKPSVVVLVFDTSRRMKKHLPEVVEAIKTLPPDTRLKLLPAGGNGAHAEEPDSRAASDGPAEVAARLAEAVTEGGADNVPALVKAWDAAAAEGRGVIVWVHGPQPILLRPVEELRQRWERRAEGPRLYAVQAENGPNLVAEKLDGIAAVESAPRTGRLRADLENLFAQLDGRKRPLAFVRSSAKLEPPNAKPAPSSAFVKETSAHLARLWASDEVGRLLSDRSKDRSEEATKLAALYQLVTPVSGAVVLETKEQYQQAGLQPVEPGSVPTIPEPEMVLLVAVAVLLYMLSRRRLSRPEAA